MAQEMGLLFKTERFNYKGFSYPLNFVCFEDSKKLGFFDSSCMQIGLNYQLMLHARDEVIEETLRHELAHLYTYLKYPENFHVLDPHGLEFRNVCKDFSWGKSIYEAKANINEVNKDLDQASLSGKRFNQIKKLLALASSSNQHEAEAATLKANQLLRKYNLEHITNELSRSDEETCFVKTVLTKKKNGPILMAIYDILTHFYVRPVFSKRKGVMALEVVGHEQSVLLADYVAKFLNTELERFWALAKTQDSQLRGISAKKSYIRGVASAFISKITRDQSLNMSTDQKSLVAASLEKLSELAYPKLRYTKTSAGKTDLSALKAGLKDGKDLSIRQGIENNKKTKLLT